MTPLGAFVLPVSGCACMPHTLACVCTHACVCPPVCPCVRCVGMATSNQLWLFIKALLPGNLVAWQHQWGSPRGDFSLAQRERKHKEEEKGSSTSSFPPSGFHLHGSAGVSRRSPLLSLNLTAQYGLPVHWRQLAIILKHIWTTHQAGNVSV